MHDKPNGYSFQMMHLTLLLISCDFSPIVNNVRASFFTHSERHKHIEILHQKENGRRKERSIIEVSGEVLMCNRPENEREYAKQRL